MKFRVTDDGTPRILAQRLVQSGLSVEQLESVFAEAALDMMRVTKVQIESRGRRGGGSWAGLRPDTIRKKGNSEIFFTAGSNQGYTKLIGRDTLVKSVTVKGAKYQSLRLNNTGFWFGTKRPYAKVQQYGGGRKVPARPFLVVLPGDIDRWKGMILNHLLRVLKEGAKSA